MLGTVLEAEPAGLAVPPLAVAPLLVVAEASAFGFASDLVSDFASAVAAFAAGALLFAA